MQTANLTTITCRTSRTAKTNLQANINVFINGSGYAYNSSLFRYMDRWSSPWTWGGTDPPENGAMVSVENGTTVYLDVTTSILKFLVIDNATLIFDDSQDLELNAEYIVIVNGGVLQVGTESNPFQHRANITLHGHSRSIELPICM